MHPISYDIDYALERNRLTTFFRGLIAIPSMIFLYIYAILVEIAVLIAWFAILFTGRFPTGLYNFVAGFIRFSARTVAWMFLATDEFPGFSSGENANYPVKVSVAAPQASYSRSKTFFKIITAVPQFILSYGISLISMGAAFVTWFRVLFTGKQSATMHDALRVSLAYQTRSSGFIFLLTEQHPRLLDLPAQDYPAGTPSLPAPTSAAAAAVGAPMHADA